MTNQDQLDRDRELLAKWEKHEGDKYHLTTFFSDTMKDTFVVENLLQAQDRVSRHEEREKIRNVLDGMMNSIYSKGDTGRAFGFIQAINELDHIINNQPNEETK